MLYSLHFLVFALSVTASFGVSIRSSLEARSAGGCADGEVVASSTVVVGSNIVELETVSCPALARRAAAIFARNTTDVCDEICTDLCGENGVLPPTTDDCAVIVDAITILNGSVSPSFDVLSNHIQQLTFGTCRFFFENLSPDTLTYCWNSLSEQASAAASACLPPVQPIHSVGFCVTASGDWEVGVGHS